MKKLDILDCAVGVTPIAEKVNEIIDHLEASKGEGERRVICKDCRERDAICSAHLCMVCLNKKIDNSPEQEWTCERCGEKNVSYVCQKCAGEQPEQEDEWDELGKQLDGVYLHNKKEVEVIDYIKANFISKERIKKEAKKLIEDYDSTTQEGWALVRLLSSLGLGD